VRAFNGFEAVRPAFDVSSRRPSRCALTVSASVPIALEQADELSEADLGKLEALFARLQVAGVSVTGVRRHPEASYAMAKGLDGLLLGVFQSDAAQMNPWLAQAEHYASIRLGRV
jgi:hypothetical protein